jgi:hypothetical protein
MLLVSSLLQFNQKSQKKKDHHRTGAFVASIVPPSPFSPLVCCHTEPRRLSHRPRHMKKKKKIWVIPDPEEEEAEEEEKKKKKKKGQVAHISFGL